MDHETFYVPVGFVLRKDVWPFPANLSFSQVRKLRPTQRKWFAQDLTDFSYLRPSLISAAPGWFICPARLSTLRRPRASPPCLSSTTSLSHRKGEQLIKTTQMALMLWRVRCFLPWTSSLLSPPHPPWESDRFLLHAQPPPPMGAQFSLSCTSLPNHLL